ncbi:hypothetical protein ACF061_36120 [Streptomyces sp. NPDC015220]|uniref:hypothetical protein n=1 Tax=Streptomyces sp. NPDC015220 TaxID=3364947 RepID=UPI003702987B
MIQQVAHHSIENVEAAASVGVTFPLAPTRKPLAPVHRTPDPDALVPQLMGLRTSAARPHRHKVPLRRLTAVAA